MLSEPQIRAMLSECEASLGRPLSSIRSKLLRQRNPIEPVWELVNVHAALKVGEVTEETSAEPDIRLALPRGDVVWIEATHVSPREQNKLDDVRTFPGWIRKELARAGVVPKDLHIELKARDPGYISLATVPPDNGRRALKQRPQWREFVSSVREKRTGTWEPGPEYNVIVQVSPGSGYTSGGPVVGIPRRPEDHVLYRAIGTKAEQIRQRSKRHEHQSLILSVCSSHIDAQIDANDPGGTHMRHAVTAALADTSGWSMGALYNHIGPGYQKGLRVPGSEYISAVVVTTLSEPSLWPRMEFHRAARSQFFPNRYARQPLTQAVLEQLASLHFNHYRYGPQWGEVWQDPLDRDDEQDQRRDRDSGSITLGLGRDNVDTVEITTSRLMRILSGKATAKEAFAEFREDTWTALQNAFSEGREIEAIEVVPADPATRETQRVRITLGPSIPPVVAVRKAPQDRVSGARAE